MTKIDMIKVIYKHWKKNETLEIIGTMPENLNNVLSDRFVVKISDGEYEDVLKDTVIRIENIDAIK